ncbi:hypothetical protein BGW80DRAFT_1445363 [Lactifluus volemus]|nr:hypothetical protein BGW80DRAFT_1445363 [Lactifluus volemus]
MQQVPLAISTGISTRTIAVATPDQMTCEDGMCSFSTVVGFAFVAISASSYSFVVRRSSWAFISKVIGTLSRNFQRNQGNEWRWTSCHASTAAPIVWTRSTELEVLNEIDEFKAGILGAAGGQSSTSRGPGSLWDTVARGVETVVGGAQVSEAVGNGLKSAAGPRYSSL